MKRFAIPLLPPTLSVLTMLTMGAAAGGGCLLYTGKINHPPNRPRIDWTRGDSRNMPILFSADATDPDGDALTYEWASTGPIDQRHPCPPLPTPDMMPPAQATGPTFLKVAMDLSQFCVWLRARDGSGSFGLPATTIASAVNSAPTATLTRQEPGGNPLGDFPLYSDFRFSASGSSDPDGDVVSRTWQLTGSPDDSIAAINDHCAPSDPTDMAACFHADVKGKYRITLGVSDGIDTTSRLAEVTVADDAPPCLLTTGTDLPARIADPAEAQIFSVTVADDGDPFPPAQPSYGKAGFPAFTWSVRRNGGAWQTVAGPGGATLGLAPGELSVGDKEEIRVEIADRVVPPRSLTVCGDDPTCALTAGCAQRLTWRVDFR